MAKISSREERAEARARRRAQSVPELDEVVDNDGEPSPADALRTAASAAIAGAAVGAAQAFARRRHAEPEAEEPEEEVEEPDDPASQSNAASQSTAASQNVSDEPGSQSEPPPRDERRSRREPRSRVSEDHDEPPRPIAAGEGPEMVERARRQLLELRGADAESVSSIRRTSDGWRVGLEVVELHRIPESTDVLATFEVMLDDDGNLLTFERTRRYYRSEAERA